MFLLLLLLRSFALLKKEELGATCLAAKKLMLSVVTCSCALGSANARATQKVEGAITRCMQVMKKDS